MKKNKILKVIIFMFILAVIVYVGRATIMDFISNIGSKDESDFFVGRSVSIDKNMADLRGKIENKQATAKDYFNLATLYAKRKDWDRAKKYYLITIQKEPGIVEAYNNLGNIYFNLGKLDKAADYYEKAKERKPDYINASINLGLVYLKKGLIERAIEEWDYVLEKDPNNKEAKSYKQWIYQ